MSTLAEMLNELQAIQLGQRPDSYLSPILKHNPMSRPAKMAGTIIPESAGFIAGALPAAWNFIGSSVNWMTGWKPPGTEGAGELVDAIHKPVRGFSNRAFGEPLNDSLLQTDDLTQLAGAWGRLLVPSLVTIPGAAVKLAQGAEKIAQGTEKLGAAGAALNATGATALKTLEILSPVLLQKPTPIVKGLSVGIPATLGVGLELAFPDVVKQNYVDAQQQFREKSGNMKVAEGLDAQAAQATDVAISGAQEIAQGAQAVKPMQPVQAGFSTGEPMFDAAILGFSAAASVYAWKRNVLKRVTAGITDEKEWTRSGDIAGLKSNIVDVLDPMKVRNREVLQGMKIPNAKQLADQFDELADASHGSAVDTKFKSIIDFGEIPGSAVRLPTSLGNYYTKVRQLGNRIPELDEYMKAIREADIRELKARNSNLLPAAMQYGTPHARIMYAQAVGRGYADDVKLAHNLHGTRVADLHRIIAAGDADPMLSALAREADAISKKMIEYAVEQRRLSRAEGAQMLAKSPHFYPMERERGKSVFAPLNLKIQGANDPGSVLEQIPRYMESVVRETEFNKVREKFLTTMRQAKVAGDPIADAMLGKQNARLGERDADRVVHYRNRNGVAQMQEVNDVLVRRSLQRGDDMSKLQMYSGFWSGWARGFESMATGAGTALVGQPFSLTSAMYTGGAGAILREKGTRAGYFDAGLQALTGGKVGVPGDMTFLVDAIARRAPEGVIAVFARRGALALEKSVTNNGVLSKAMSPASATALSQAMVNFYKRTWPYQLQQSGNMGPAGSGGFNPSQSLRDAQNRMLSVNVPKNIVNDSLTFINEILHAVSASPGGSAWAFNKHLDPLSRSRAVRNLAGDPGKSGAFEGRAGSVIGKGTSITPWGNIIIQSTEKLMREMTKNKGTNAPKILLGMFNAVGIPTIGAALWTLGLPDYVDPDGNSVSYVDYLINKRNPDRQASSIYVPLPGVAPEHGLEIPMVDPLMRIAKVAIEAQTYQQLGMFDNIISRPENAGMRDAFIEMHRRRWESFGEGSVMRSAAAQSLLPPIPPLGGAIAAGMGVQWRNYGDSSGIFARNDAGYTESDARNPNRSFIGVAESAEAEHVVRALGANAGHTLYNMFMEGAQRVNEGRGIGDATSNAVKIVRSSAKDSSRAFSGALFDAFAAISPSQESAGKSVKVKIDSLKRIAEAYESTTRSGASTQGEMIGTKKRGFTPLLGGATTVGPADIVMSQLGTIAQERYRALSEMYLGPNKDLFEQRQSIQGSTKFSPEEKRSRMNFVSEQIIENNRQALKFLQQFEYAASQKLGRPVRLEQIKLGKGSE